MLNRLQLYFSMVRYANAHNRDFAVEHWDFFRIMCDRLKAWGKDPAGLRVLEIGCGKSYWLTLLMQSYGARITGVDPEKVYSRRNLEKYLSIGRENGVERALRTLVWDYVYALPYYRELEHRASFTLQHSAVDVRCCDISTQDDFAPGEFDLVVSHEVFEHIADVERVVARLRRLLKPDGLTYIYIHVFTSLSGGHHIAWKYPDTEPSQTVPPWDHLRENKFPDIPSWVNGFRVDQYKEIFSRHFDVLDWLPIKKEGVSLLTPEIRHELSEYTEDELLIKGYIVIAKPKVGAHSTDNVRT